MIRRSGGSAHRTAGESVRVVARREPPVSAGRRRPDVEPDGNVLRAWWAIPNGATDVVIDFAFDTSAGRLYLVGERVKLVEQWTDAVTEVAQAA